MVNIKNIPINNLKKYLRIKIIVGKIIDYIICTQVLKELSQFLERNKYFRKNSILIFSRKIFKLL